MIKTANINKNKGLSTIAAVLMGATVFGLQGCGGGDDDSTSAVMPDITISSASVSEGSSGTTDLDFTVILSQATTTNVTTSYSTSDGTALAGQDYTTTSGTLTVPAGATSATITVPVTGDGETEADETFSLQINNAVNGTIANNSVTVTGSIVNDDLAGYYTGSASVNLIVGGTLDPADIQVIAANDRLVIISLTHNLVYIAPFTGFSQNSFLTTARIYKDGDFTTTTEISGTYITGASLDLTLAGTGDYTTGTVTLVYSAENAITPLVLGIPFAWNGTSAGIAINTNTNIDIASIASVPSAALNSCDSKSVNLINVVSEQTGRIREFSAVVNGCTFAPTNLTTLNGYFTAFQEAVPDDRLLFIWFNDDGAHADIMQ